MEFKMPEIINSIIYGDQNFTIPSHMNCGKLFVDKLFEYKEKIALVRFCDSKFLFYKYSVVMWWILILFPKINGATGETITFGDMVQRIVNTADALIKLGVKRDDVVGVCSENRMEYLIAAIAIWCSGAIATFLNSGYSKSKFSELILDFACITF